MATLEEVKNFWDGRPCNIRHSKKEVGTKEYFEEVREKKFFVEPHIVDFADFSSWKGKKVLEVGCGIGTTAIEFARAGAIVTAVDLSKTSLDLAKLRAEKYGLDNITFYHGNAEELGDILPDEKYDLIWSFGVIHHTPNPNRVTEEIKKFMDENTILRIMVYYKWSWKVLWIILKYGFGAFWKADELVKKYSEAQEGCPQTEIYDRNTIKNLLPGYTIKKCRVEHIFRYQIKWYKQNIYKTVWYFNWIPKSIFKKLEKILGWHLCVEATL